MKRVALIRTAFSLLGAGMLRQLITSTLVLHLTCAGLPRHITVPLAQVWRADRPTAAAIDSRRLRVLYSR